MSHFSAFARNDLLMDYNVLQEIRQAAEFLELPQLVVLLSNSQSNESFLNDETTKHYSAVRNFQIIL